MSTPGLGRISIGLVLLGALLAASWFASHRMLADMYNQQARYYIDRWRAGKLQLSPARLDELQAELKSAIALDHTNPNLHEDLARFHAWRSEQGSLADSTSRAARVEARTYFTQAAVLRPTSQRAWAGVAYLRFMLGEVDDQFGSALKLALLRGPWDSEIQMTAIHIGIASWQILTPELQDQLRRAIYNQAHWKLAPQKVRLQLLIEVFRRPELACLLEVSGPKSCPPA